MKLKQTGTVFDNHGLWYYSVQLPGEKKRRQVPLKAPGAKRTMRTDRPRKMVAMEELVMARRAARVTPVYGKRKNAPHVPRVPGDKWTTDAYTFDAVEEEMIRRATPAVEALG